MKIISFKVDHLRSANHAELQQVDSLNVLIGKNNSGKSTLLSAINAFFVSLKREGLVNLAPPVGRTLDFYDQQLDHPIEIAASFLLAETERSNLVRDIVSEAVQLKNLIEGMGAELTVEVSLSITPEPDSYAYVSTLNVIGSGVRGPADSKNLLTVSPGTAAELASRQRRVGYSEQVAEQVQRFLENFDSDDFDTAKADETGVRSTVRGALSYRRSPGEVSLQIIKDIEELLGDSDSYPEFRARVKSLRDSHLAEVSSKRSPLKNLIQTFSGAQNTVPEYAENLLKAIAAIPVLFLGERREPVGRPEALQLLQYKTQRGGLDKLSSIQKKILEMLNVKIDAFENESTRGIDRNVEMDVDNFLLEVNGSGIKEALRLILDIELKSPAVLLVEEPEVHLHPALETNLMRYLREVSAGCQVFITTHSTNFLDSPTTDNIYLVSKPEKETIVKLLSVGEAEDTLPSELGIRLSSLFLFDRLVFVEGVSDEEVIRELAAKIGINLTKSNVGFVHMGGSRNFFYFATLGTLQFLAKRQVKCFFVMDRDEKTEDEIQDLKKRVGDNATVLVLQRRELENYLLSPRPMTELLNWKLRHGVTAAVAELVDMKRVHDSMLRVVETVKPLVVGKRSAKRLFTPLTSNIAWPAVVTPEEAQKLISDELLRLKGAVTEKSDQSATTIEEVRKAVEGSWRNTAWDVIMGDELLDTVFREFGARFKKVTDSPRLARLFLAEEINAELVNVIKLLVS